MNSRHRRRFVLLAPFALICLVLLFVGGPGYDSLRSYRYIWGAGHLFTFALWTYLYSLSRNRLSFQRLFLDVMVLTVVIGGGTELVQAGIGREGTWPDLGCDLVGSLFGLFFCVEGRRNLRPVLLKAFQIPVVALIVWTLYPTARVIVDDLVARKQFPLLSGFETALEASRWSGSASRTVSREFASSGQASLKIRLSTQRYSGLGLKDFPRDWSGYGAVSLRVYNPDPEPLQLHFRIHDHLHDNSYRDRFNRSFTLESGWNQLTVMLDKVAEAPKDRRLDLSRIAGMHIFVGKLERPRTIYLDDVRLVPRNGGA